MMSEGGKLTPPGSGDVGHRRGLPQPTTSEVLDLGELAEKHALKVPFRIRVVNGFMAADNMKDPTFGVDEIYSVHLVKETKVLKTRCADKEYLIPINSTATFGLIQDESNESRVFGTIGELISSHPRPTIVAALNDCTDNNGVLLVRKNDILALQDVNISRMRKRKSCVKAYSISMGMEILLYLDMELKFTINPSYIQLYLTDLMEHIDLPMFCKVSSNNSSLSKILPSSKVQLLEQETQRSVLVSLFRSNPNSKQKKVTSYIEIPTRINIIVSIMDNTGEEEQVYQQIMEESRDLLHNYNSAKIQACMDSENDDAYMTQAQLLAEVRKEREKKTLTRLAPQNYEEIVIGEKKDLEKDLKCDPKAPVQRQSAPVQSAPVQQRKSPSALKPVLPLPPKRPATTLKKSRLPPPIVPRPEATLYEELDQTTRLSPSTYELTNIVKTPEKEQSSHSTPPSARNAAVDSRLSPLNSSSKISENAEDARVSKQIQGIHEKLQDIENQIGQILTRQSHLEDEVKLLKLSGRQLDGRQASLTIHRGTSPAQILEVLDDVGLSQYREAFARELIDGEIFAILDDDMLANELGVVSKIHRMRLMRLFREN